MFSPIRRILITGLLTTAMSAALALPAFADPPLPPKPLVPADFSPTTPDDMVGEEVAPELLRWAADRWYAIKLQPQRKDLIAPRPGVLASKRIALSPGHGITLTEAGGWGFQRDLVLSLREDIHTNQWAIDYIIPMLERAGAEIIHMRERTYGNTATVVDNDTDSGYVEIGTWATGASAGFGGTYRYAFLDPTGSAKAQWHFQVQSAGVHPVYIYYLSGTNRTASAHYRLDHLGGVSAGTINQADLHVQNWSTTDPPPPSNTSRQPTPLWRYIGSFPFLPGTTYTLELSNLGTETDKVVIADAIHVGGGMGTVTTASGAVSGQARWVESARAFLTWKEAPSWMRGSDVTIRPLYAIYEGVDAYLSVHTNCCNSSGTSTWVWYPEMWVGEASWPANHAAVNLPPGTIDLARNLQRDVVARVRAGWDPDWRGGTSLMGANFGELRPIRNAWYNDKNVHNIDPPLTIPAALMELAFHDTAYDARLIRELGFRHDIARGMLSAFIRFYRGADAMIPPLPPQQVSAVAHDFHVQLRWEATPDALANAPSTSFYVYTSTDGVLFEHTPIQVNDNHLQLPLPTCEPLYFKITAVNAAGESLDSRTVGVKRSHPGGARVLYVDGVTREVKTVHDPNNLRTYARIYGPAMAGLLPGVGFDMVDATAAVTAIAAHDYNLVIWAVGETSTRDNPLPKAQQSAISQLHSDQTPLIISGSELAWFLATQSDAADQSFLTQTLGAVFAADGADSTTIDAASFGLGNVTFGDCSADAVCVEFPDAINAASGGAVVLRYHNNAGAVVRHPSRPILLAGFPLESVANPTTRINLIRALANTVIDTNLATHLDCAVPPIVEPDPELQPEPVELVDTMEVADDIGPDLHLEVVEEATDVSPDLSEDLSQPPPDASPDASEELTPTPPNATKVGSECACHIHHRAPGPGQGWLVGLGLAALFLVLLRRRRHPSAQP